MRPFEPFDLLEINGWYAKRMLATLTTDHIPRLGRIEPGIAAGFLYLTDARAICLLEGFVTNPDASLRRRAKAIKEITESLMCVAKQRGFTGVIGLCRAPSVERLAHRLGFLRIGTFPMMAKEL